MDELVATTALAQLMDLAIVVLVVVTAYFGYRRGFARTTWSLVGWLVSIGFALAFQKETLRMLEPYFSFFGALTFVSKAIAFSGLVVAGNFIFTFIGSVFFEPLVARAMRGRPGLARVDHYLGPVPAIGRVLVMSSAVLTTVALVPRADDVKTFISGSALGRPMLAATSSLQVGMAQDVADRESAPLFEIGRKLGALP
jgi:hypothetical protein